jgi:adenylate kinase
LVKGAIKRPARKGKLVIITGVPGVGKTTVLVAALDLCKSLSLHVRHVNYGDVMFEMATAQGLVKVRDEIRRLPVKAQVELQLAAASKIVTMAKESNVILDTHMFVRTPDGYMPGIPSWVAESLLPDSIVLLEAEPEEISRRRTKDAEIRIREADSAVKVAEHQLLGRAGAAALSVLTGCTVTIAENREGGHMAAAEVIADLFRVRA